MLELDYKLIYTDNISWGIIDEELFVFDEAIGKVYLFKGTEKEIWLSIRYGEVLSKLVILMNNKYNVDAVHTIKVVEKLHKWNLVKRV